MGQGKGFEDSSEETVWAHGAGMYDDANPDDDVAISVPPMNEGAVVLNPLQLRIYLWSLEDEEASAGCRNADGEGWTASLPTGAGGRATGAGGCITKEMLGTGSPARTDIPGYEWAREFSEAIFDDEASKMINSCHLIASSLGGSGDDKANLATCPRAANFHSSRGSQDEGMRVFERAVQSEVKSGNDVLYKVAPQYLGDRVVPYAFKLSAWSIGEDGARTTMFENEIVHNELYGINLGIHTENGQPVPLR